MKTFLNLIGTENVQFLGKELHMIISRYSNWFTQREHQKAVWVRSWTPNWSDLEAERCCNSPLDRVKLLLDVCTERPGSPRASVSRDASPWCCRDTEERVNERGGMTRTWHHSAGAHVTASVFNSYKVCWSGTLNPSRCQQMCHSCLKCTGLVSVLIFDMNSNAHTWWAQQKY